MDNLIIDIGNTAIKLTWADASSLGSIYRYQGEKYVDFILSFCTKQRANIMIISSPYIISKSIKDLFSNYCNKLLLLDPSNKEILEDYNLPTYLSYDRAASIIAVKHYFYSSSFTLFDIGNTLTVDYISDKGELEKSYITPGCRTRLRALNKYSKSLPLLNIQDMDNSAKDSLKYSIAEGVRQGIIYEIEAFMAEKANNNIIFTGGDSFYFAKRMKKSIFVFQNIVLKGLALIADNNVEKVNL